MPYDITDAKEDIQLLDSKITYLIEVLKEKELLPKEDKKEWKQTN